MRGSPLVSCEVTLGPDTPDPYLWGGVRVRGGQGSRTTSTLTPDIDRVNPDMSSDKAGDLCPTCEPGHDSAAHRGSRTRSAHRSDRPALPAFSTYCSAAIRRIARPSRSPAR